MKRGPLHRCHRRSSPSAHRRGEKGDSADNDEALGRNLGGLSTKVHLRAEGNGKPMTLCPTPGQQHEATVFEPPMEQGAII